MAKLPGYEERSKQIQSELDGDRTYQKLQEEVQEMLLTEAPASVKALARLRDQSKDESVVRNSAKDILTLAGVATKKVEITGPVTFKPYNVLEDEA